MEQKNNEQTKTFEIDLNRVFSALKQRLLLIVLAAVLTGAAAFGCAEFLVTPMY